MKIALIFETEFDFLEKQILSIYLIDYLNENDVYIDLYTSFSAFISELNNNRIRVFRYKNLKEILKKNYSAIYNFGSNKIALYSGFFPDIYQNFFNIINEQPLSSYFPEVNNVIPMNTFFKSSSENISEFFDYIVINLPSHLELTDITFIKNVSKTETKKYFLYPDTNNMNEFGLEEKYSSDNNIFISKNDQISFDLLEKSKIVIDLSESYFSGLYSVCKNKEVFSLPDKAISKYLPEENIITDFDNFKNIYIKGRLDKGLKALSSYVNNSEFHPENNLSPDLREKTFRIVFVVNATGFNGDTPFNKGLGGTESAIVYISRQFAKSGHEVIIFNNCGTKKIYDGVLYEPIENYPEFSVNNITDILICVRGSFIFPELKAKVIIFWTEDDYNQPMSNSFITDSHNGFLVDLIIVVSNYQKNAFIKHFNTPEEKYFVTRNGINPEFFYKKRERKKFKLVYTSTPYRGLKLLINIFPEIKKAIPEAELDIYSSMSVHGLGSVSDRKDYGYIFSEISKIEGINIMEPLSQPKLAEVLLEAYLFTYPNIFPETSCISALEAQAAGLPVITSEFGALTETVRNNETGICISGNPLTPEFQKTFAETVISFLKDETKWSEFSNKAQKRMFENFTWEKIAKEWITEFEFLISEYEILKKLYRYIEKLNSKSNDQLIDQYLDIYFEFSQNFSNVKLLYWEVEILENFLKLKNLPAEKREKISQRAQNIKKFI